jgi:hypothetical protein
VTAEAPPPIQEFDWESAGRGLGPGLDRLHAIAILGSNQTETARVAVGIARQQARKRRVALGDLLGDAEPLLELAPSDNPEGLADVFEYGVSLSKVARPVEGPGELFLLPSGAFISDEAAIMSNRRWTRLAAGFREEQALLIVVASVSAPEVESLVLQLDGAIIVGDMAPARLPVSRVLGSVAGPHAIVPVRPVERRERQKYVIRGRTSLWRIGATIGVTLTAVIAALGFWLATRPFADSAWAPLWLRGDTTETRFRGLDVVTIDSIRRADSLSQIEKAMGLFTAQDSASVAPYGLSLVTFNTQAGALLELRRNSATLRAGTFTPVLIRETTWFRVVAGAYPDSASAAALLDTLRARGLTDASRVEIDRFPYALLIQRDVPDTLVASRVGSFQGRNLPVYALLQHDGTARLFAGAFKTPEESTLLAEAMKSAGVPTSLVFRTGRVY